MGGGEGGRTWSSAFFFAWLTCFFIFECCTMRAFIFHRYAHYDASPSFSDWRSFGAWTRPAIKQFNDGPAVCGAKSEKRAHSAAQPASQRIGSSSVMLLTLICLLSDSV